MKVVVVKTWTNGYGRTFEPTGEVLEMWEDKSLMDALVNGNVIRYGSQPEVRMTEEIPLEVKKTKIKNKSKEEK